MSALAAALILISFVLAGPLGSNEPAPASPDAPHVFENQYVKLTVPPGWTVDSRTPTLVRVTHGKFFLTIDPMLGHSTAFASLETIAQRLPSVAAVMSEVIGPWPTSCAQPENVVETAKIRLYPLYTDA